MSQSRNVPFVGPLITGRWNCGTSKCSNRSQNDHARVKQCIFCSYNTELKLIISRSGLSVREAKLAIISLLC